MSRVGAFFGALALSVALPFSAAAQNDERDFRVPARFFQPGALPNAVSQPVEIFCQNDFNWKASPVEPTQALLERIDTMGFGGGEEGTIAFLTNPAERQPYLNSLSNQGARSYYETIAREYDASSDKIEYLKTMLNQNHGWGAERYDQIEAQCRKLGLDG